MKKLFILILLCAVSQLLRAQVENPGDAAKDGATDHVNNNISNGVDNGLNKTENAIKGIFKKKPKQQQQPQQPNTAQQQNNSVQKPADNAQQQDGSIKVYQNYDFVPGDKIIFDDELTDGPDGEFPPHWELGAGQGTTNKVAGREAFVLTDGNYVKVSPRIKV